MIMEDCVTYEVAKKLKEKGFRELCLAYYTNDDTLYHNYSHKSGACYKDCYLSHNLMPKGSISGKFVDAPTISQVLKWLRKEKNIHVTILVITDFSTEADNNICEEWSFWSFYVTNLNDGSTIYNDCQRIDSIEYQSYEESAIAGIEYVFDNLI